MRLGGRVFASKHTARGLIERIRVLREFGIAVANLVIEDRLAERAKADLVEGERQRRLPQRQPTVGVGSSE